MSLSLATTHIKQRPYNTITHGYHPLFKYLSLSPVDTHNIKQPQYNTYHHTQFILRHFNIKMHRQSFIIWLTIIIDCCVLLVESTGNETGSACTAPGKVTGPCRSSQLSWSYDIEKGVCEKFIYGGCQGTPNNFRTKENCLKTCKPSMCTAPGKVAGLCRGKMTRWSYVIEKDACENFFYGGCQGTSNNFKTIEDCMQTCKPKSRRGKIIGGSINTFVRPADKGNGIRGNRRRITTRPVGLGRPNKAVGKEFKSTWNTKIIGNPLIKNHRGFRKHQFSTKWHTGPFKIPIKNKGFTNHQFSTKWHTGPFKLPIIKDIRKGYYNKWNSAPFAIPMIKDTGYGVGFHTPSKARLLRALIRIFKNKRRYPSRIPPRLLLKKVSRCLNKFLQAYGPVTPFEAITVAEELEDLFEELNDGQDIFEGIPNDDEVIPDDIGETNEMLQNMYNILYGNKNHGDPYNDQEENYELNVFEGNPNNDGGQPNHGEVNEVLQNEYNELHGNQNPENDFKVDEAGTYDAELENSGPELSNDQNSFEENLNNGPQEINNEQEVTELQNSDHELPNGQNISEERYINPPEEDAPVFTEQGGLPHYAENTFQPQTSNAEVHPVSEITNVPNLTYIRRNYTKMGPTTNVKIRNRIAMPQGQAKIQGSFSKGIARNKTLMVQRQPKGQSIDINKYNNMNDNMLASLAEKIKGACETVVKVMEEHQNPQKAIGSLLRIIHEVEKV